MSNCSAISWQEQVIFRWDDDDVHLVPDQHASSLKQQFMGRQGVQNQTYQINFYLYNYVKWLWPCVQYFWLQINSKEGYLTKLGGYFKVSEIMILLIWEVWSSSKNKLYFDEMMMMSTLYQTNMLAPWNNSSWVDRLLYLNRLTWLRVNQSIIHTAIFVKKL
jgi:hypothetical protein